MSNSAQARLPDDCDGPCSPSLPGSFADTLAEARSRLDSRAQDTSIVWHFDHRGARYEARFTAAGPRRLRIALQGELGWLPFSAEDRGARRQALRSLARLRGEGEDGWTLSDSGLVGLACVTLVEDGQADRPPLEALVLLMLSLSPRLDPLLPLLRPLSPEKREEAATVISDAA